MLNRSHPIIPRHAPFTKEFIQAVVLLLAAFPHAGRIVLLYVTDCHHHRPPIADHN